MQIAILSFFHYFTKMFKNRESILEVEEGNLLSPKFNDEGLIPVITTDFKSGEVLMHGYMNEEALKKTIETKEAYYWSRSRKILWHKGKTSGFVQKVIELRVDDDQDAIWMSVDIGDGASCHVGYRSCFYRSIPLGAVKDTTQIEIKFKEKEKKFDPKKIYKGQPNPTKL
jgi:phosphoribosyl-AMP cyclohydrolase